MAHQEFLPFFCPIESAIHPQVEVIEKNAAVWLNNFELYTTPTRHAWILGTNSAEFYCRIAPHAFQERLQLAAQWTYWGFALDDAHCDRGPTSTRTGEFVAMAARLLGVLEGQQAVATLRDPYEAALADIAAGFRRHATPTQLRRWVNAQRSWLFAVAWGVSMAESHPPSDVGQYLAYRINSCGGEPTTAMIEMVNGGEISSTEMDSPTVIALTEATRMVAALDNDLVSYRKELLLQEKGPNIINVLSRKHDCSETEAVFRATAIRDRVMSLFLRLSEQVRKNASHELRTYVADLGHTIRGNIEWSLAVPRYNSLTKTSVPMNPATIPVEWSDHPSDSDPAPLPVPAIAWWWDQLT